VINNLNNTSFQNFIDTLDHSGKQFEHFVKWFLENDPEWSSIIDRVWLWDDWPERWGPDCGIDLIFSSKSGETWAVQAKQYSRDYYITKQDVDTFLSESSRSVIDQRLLIATTDHLGPNALRVMRDQEKPVTRFLADHFEKADVTYPTSLDDLFEIQPKPKPKPRDYQKDAIADVVAGFESEDRGQLIMACGTGKTYVTLWIKERLNANNVLVLLPSLNLLSQTLHEWAGAANEQFEALCVCSDEGVAKRNNDAVVTRPEDVPFPVYSDPLKISAFLSRSGCKVVFCTYQSSPLIAEVQRNLHIPNFDLVIADEAHRCAGKTDSAFATALDSKLIRSRRRLFATATPRTYTSSLKKSAAERGVEVIGMDDPEVFGSPFHTLSFKAAIEHDPPLLTDFQVLIVGVNDAMIAEWIRDRELLETSSGDSIDAESLAAQIGCIKAIRDYGIKRAISFHSRVKAAEHFSQDIRITLDELTDEQRPDGRFWSDYVSGAMPTDQRLNKLKVLKDLHNADVGVLSNARCLSEGVDVPALDSVMFIDPKSSQVDIVQAVGRAIRLSENKSVGTIVLPVFIEASDDAETEIESSRFKPIWDVVNALRAHDGAFADQLDNIRTELGRRHAATIDRNALSKVVFDLPIGIDESFANSIATKLVEKTTASWDYWYGLLLDFRHEHGHGNVPQFFKTKAGHKLGFWASNQRSKRYRLSDSQIARLNALEFVWEPLEEQWEEGFRHLNSYYDEFGHTKVPAKYRTHNEFGLGVWTSRQRKNKSLTEEQRTRLDALEFDWDPLSSQWEEGFEHLTAFVAAFGHCRVLRQYESNDGFKLGSWIHTQRRSFETLPVERKRRLATLGFVLDPTAEQWEDGFAHLKAFTEEFEHCSVPKGYVSQDGFVLSTWVATQRYNAAKSKLSNERKERLESLGFVWQAHDQKWEEGFEHLEAYVQKHGHCRVPNKYKSPDGFALGQWNARQRKKTSIDNWQRARLNELGFVWDPHKLSWEEGLAHLEAYAQEFGHCRVPNKYISPDGYLLGGWVSNTRLRGRSKLSHEQNQQLDQMDFIWKVNELRWEEAFHDLKEFVQQTGHNQVPRQYKTADGFALGRWVVRQKEKAKQGNMSKENTKRLSSLGFVWQSKNKNDSG